MASPDAPRGHRVLIAAFVLPYAVDFSVETTPAQEEVALLPAPSSPAPRQANTQQLADLLATRLQVAVNQQEGRQRGTPPLLAQPGPDSRHSAGTRERVNMAELMAEASGSGSSYLHTHSASQNASRGASPPIDAAKDEGSALLTVGSLSDHGRRASQPEGPRARSRRNSGTPSVAPLFTPLTSAMATTRTATPLALRDPKGTPPTSIISDMAAKHNSQAVTTAPTPGSALPYPSRHTATPLLLDHPELASGAIALPDQGGTHSAPSTLTHESAPPAPASSGLQILPSGRVTVQDELRPPPESPTCREAHSSRRHAVEKLEATDPAPPRWGSLLRRSSKLSQAMRSRSVSYKASGAKEQEASVPFTFVPNPGANYGLINAVNSVGDERFPHGLRYIGTLGIQMEWVPPALRHEVDQRAQREHDCIPVWVGDNDYVNSYHLYCKCILWPTFHYTSPSAEGLHWEHHAFRAYKRVNQAFADRIVETYEEGDMIWVQDYHLLLVPQMVREKLPRATIGLFVHIAFPSSEIFRCLSEREALLRGMLGADLIGFQTHNFCRHFCQTVSRILQLQATPRGIQLNRRFVSVAPFPIGIDVRTLNRKRADPEVGEWVERLQERFAGKHVIVGRDKLDWIKGVREKLLGFELFLDEHPAWVGQVVLVQVALATVKEDREVGEAMDIVARINRKHSSLMYQPVVFLHVQEITFSHYLALLTVADVFLATSLREGMNLTSHEYVISQEARKRPLILSEFTGTYSALRACIGINPWNTRQVSDAIEQALAMSREEMTQRWDDLHRTVVGQTAQHWITSVLSQLERAHERQPSATNLFIPRLEIAQLVSEWRSARPRLILVDLEQTLVLEDAAEVHRHGFRPSAALLQLLQRLVEDPSNYVYLLSSKSKKELDTITSHVQVGAIAEHGCFVQHCAAPAWTSLIDGYNLDWRTPVREILSYFTERTPGSWVEERQASISWHFNQHAPDTTAAERQWAQRQASEVQGLIYDSLGDRFSLRIVHGATHFTVMPKNVSWTSAVQYILTLDAMGKLAPRGPDAPHAAGTIAFVLQIGNDERLISYVNQLDLAFAPRTCTTTDAHGKPSSEASYYLAPGHEVLSALDEIVSLRRRELKWGGPATLDI